MAWPSVDSPQAAVPHTSAASSPLPPTESAGLVHQEKEVKEGLWVQAYLQTTTAILQTFESCDGAFGLCRRGQCAQLGQGLCRWQR